MSSRLAAIDETLLRLQVRHDLAMSACKFDEAGQLQQQICALEDERRAVAATLPAVPAAAEPETGVIPALARPPRGRRR